jgi:hypothetical protein
VFFCTLSSFDQLPAFLNSHSSWHLGGSVFIAGHGSDANGYMPPPRRSRKHKVKFFFLTHPLEIKLTSRVPPRSWLTCRFNPVLHSGYLVFNDVAYCCESNAFNPKKIPTMRRTLKAHPNKTNPHNIDRRHGQQLIRSRLKV